MQMITRSSYRLAATLLVVLFLVTNTRDALGLGCPHHELGEATNLSATSDDHPAGHGAILVDLKRDHEIDQVVEQEAEHEHHCTCIGTCNGIPGTPPPPSAIGRLDPGEAIDLSPLLDSEHHLPGPIPYLLPLANAPPPIH